MSLLSSLKSLFGGDSNAHAKSTVTVSTPAQNTARKQADTQAATDARVKDEQAQLDALLAQPAGAARDAQLAALAAASPAAAVRWAAAQGVVGETGWLALQNGAGQRDRRVGKWAKEQITATRAVQAKQAAWSDIATGYTSLLQSPSVDVRHFIELDKTFDTAHAQHGFDAADVAQVEQWRATLQGRLQTQNEAQRAAQVLRDGLKSMLATAQSGQYSDALQAQYDSALTQHSDLPHAHGLVAISRLHTEINALLPETHAALQHAQAGANRLQAAQSLAAEAQKYAFQSPSQLSGAAIADLKSRWMGGFNSFTAEKTQFDTAIVQANKMLATYQSQLADRHEQSMVWLNETQAKLAAAIEAGHGIESVQLAAQINDAAGKTLDLSRLPSEQGAALERLLAQARETRGLLWEGAAHARDDLIAKVEALAAKPLVAKFQEAAVKEATAAWKALTEKSGDAPAAQFAAFKAACDQAWSPVKDHKANMKEVMAKGTAQRQALIDELQGLIAQADWGTIDWRGVETFRREARKQWRECLPSEYAKRDAMNAAYDAVMKQVDDKIDGARAAELARRQSLTAAALALEGKPFPEQHAGGRALMERYNAERSSVFLPRDADLAAWDSFRKAIDAIYARRETDRKAEQAENAAAISELIADKQATLDTLKAACAASDATLKTLTAALNETQRAWDAPGPLPRGMGEHGGVNIDALVKDWLAAQTAAKARIAELHQAAQAARSEQALTLARALDAEPIDMDAMKSLWAAAQQDPVVKKAFATRVNAAVSGTPLLTSASLATALLDAEIATQTASPEAYQDARLKRQVQRLSDKLSGNNQGAVDAGFNAWLAALVLPGATVGDAGVRLDVVAESLAF